MLRNIKAAWVKVLGAAVAALLTGAVAYASNLPLFNNTSVCADPALNFACANSIVQTINSGVNGLLAFLPGPIASTATTNEQILAQTTIPGGTLASGGQSLRLKCGGSSASNTNTKSAKLYYGTTSISTGNFSTSAETWELELLVSYAPTQPNSVYIGRGTINTTVVAPVSSSNTTDNLSTNLVAKCTATQGSASASDMLLYNFIIEQIK